MADASEVALEQKYFDHAQEMREATRQRLLDAPGAAANAGAARLLREQSNAMIDQLGEPDSAVAFGRIDLDDNERFYIGLRQISDEGNDPIVISWKSPVGGLFEQATMSDPCGLNMKRSFTTDHNRILDFEQILFNAISDEMKELGLGGEAPAEGIPDALLVDLSRNRTGEMQNIVRTIQAEQSRIMRDDPNQLLVVQGGPGTGKTQIGLHRASWIIFNSESSIGTSDLLVVGPSRTFIRYISKVLPGLGDSNVRQLPVSALVPSGSRATTEDSTEVAILKGELRMRTLFRRALADRISPPEESLEVVDAGKRSRIEQRDVIAAIDGMRSVPYMVGRSNLRSFLRTRFGMQDVDSTTAIDGMVERIWPQLTAQSFLQDLFGSEARLVTAAGDDFTAREVRLLYRRRAERLADEIWTTSDLPLLDYADSLMRGLGTERYSHIIIDEAQDLSPMELDSISRRSSNGAYTVIGDMAQSTGMWARDSWQDVIEILKKDMPSKVSELEFGYRVPSQIFEFARMLLPASAPEVTPPIAVREGPADPKFVSTTTNDRSVAVVEAVREHAGHGFLVGIICPGSLRDNVALALDAADMSWTDANRDGELGATITLVTATEAKGLEFDAVVVVEPEEIVREDQRGLRLLYVALTRATKYLTVVHAERPFPLLDADPVSHAPGDANDTRALPSSPTSSKTPSPLGPIAVDRITGVIASEVASQIRATVAPEKWEDLIDLLIEELLGGSTSE